MGANAGGTAEDFRSFVPDLRDERPFLILYFLFFKGEKSMKQQLEEIRQRALAALDEAMAAVKAEFNL